MRVRRALALCVGLGVLSLPACTGADPDSPGSTLPPLSSTVAPPTTTAPPSTSVSPTAEQLIEAQWKGYWTDLVKLQGGDEATVKLTLAKYAETSQVKVAYEALKDQATKGYTQTGGITFGKLQVSVSGDKAILKECRDFQDMVVKDASGKVVLADPPDVAYQAGMSLIEGVWLISDSQGTEGPCQ